MDEVFVEIEGLVKRFGPFTAVDGLSFQVRRGEVLGFLGPNGAGKSTTMKMITGFLTPSEGRVSICGNDIREAPIAAQSLIGYLPEGAPAYGDMTPRQYLKFIAEVRGYHGGRAERAVDRAASRAQLGGVMDQLIDTLSKGFKRRVGLAQAILHDPPVLIMDEPTDGLDPNQKFAVRRLITGMARNKAIIISTHILEEVESVCSRALIIDRGRIVADGTPDELAARSRYHNAVTLRMRADAAAAARTALETLPGIGDILSRRTPSGTEQFTLFPRDPAHLLIEDVSELVSSQKWEVSALYAEAGRLDEVFRTLTTSDADAARRKPAAGATRGEPGSRPTERPEPEQAESVPAPTSPQTDDAAPPPAASGETEGAAVTAAPPTTVDAEPTSADGATTAADGTKSAATQKTAVKKKAAARKKAAAKTKTAARTKTATGNGKRAVTKPKPASGEGKSTPSEPTTG